MVNIDYDVKRFVDDATEIDRQLKEKGLNSQKNNIKTKDKVRAYLKTVFGKCVFCEASGKHDIEHYRPKGAVTGFKNDKNGRKHPGYYWLSDEITNFLWVCRDCNGAKHCKFPIKGERVFAPTENSQDRRIDSKELQQEEPLLLNPLIHSPEDYLKINYVGKLLPINNSKKAATTIQICDLNRHSLSYDKRKKIIDDFFKVLIEQLDFFKEFLESNNKKHSDFKDIKSLYKSIFGVHFSGIIKRKNRDNEFSRVYHFIYFEFENFLNNNEYVNKDLLASDKEFIINAFNMLTQK